jgi:hypothetical protein
MTGANSAGVNFANLTPDIDIISCMQVKGSKQRSYI